MNKGKMKNKKWDLPKLVFSIFSFFLLLLYAQLVYLSLSKKIYGKNMNEFASSRNTIRQNIKAKRGTIYDKNKDILALNVSSYTLIAYLDEARKNDYVKDINLTAEKLASVLGKDEEYFKKIIEKGKKNNKKQVEFGTVGRGITELVKEEIESLDLDGIDFTETSKRYYPNGDFASYVLGYAKDKEVTYKNDDGERVTKTEITGELGIESEYNDLLKGKDGYLEYQQDRYGYKISGTKEISEKALNGYDIYLTIDSNIQRFVEGAIKDATDKYDPKLMSITVMDAKNGNILATSSTPSFDPNVRDIKNYENPLVSYTYEPGSTMKIYAYMCAIDNGVYDGTAKFKSGSYKIGDDTVKDWNKTGWGSITYDKGFEYSSNVGIANLLNKYLTKKQLQECYRKYGFGKTTGVELTRENRGSMAFNYPIEVATAGFGQGISTTAIQQLQALTLISNNGKILKPHIVDKIVNPNTNKIYYQSKKEESEQLVKKSSVDRMKDLMFNVVNGTDIGTTGKKYKIEGFDIIGKTGTAEISENGRYLKDRYIYSFAGMYPKDDPEIIIYAMIKCPKYNSADALYESVKDIINSISKYKDIDVGKEKVESYTLKSYISKDIDKVTKELEDQDLDVMILGDGDKVIKQYPVVGTKVVSKDRIILLTNDSDLKMPSLKNLSRLEAIKVLEFLDIKYKIEGYGYVYDQSISKGASIDKDSKITLKLKSDYIEEEDEDE